MFKWKYPAYAFAHVCFRERLRQEISLWQAMMKK
jgi:hypothetical protein